MQAVGTFDLVWGESLRWDHLRDRLYFVDCATRTLHWLDGGSSDLQSLILPGVPTGVVLTDGPEIVVCLDDGLHLVEADSGATRLLAAYPDGIHGRANDANAAPDGALITGTLSLSAGPGALWRYSTDGGWTLLDGHFGNTNGPVFTVIDGEPTLIVGDTNAGVLYRYPYGDGTTGPRTVFLDQKAFGGAPDGATVDADGGVWTCVLRVGKLIRATVEGVDRTIDLPMKNPSDVTFGGAALDRLYLTAIAADLGQGTAPEASRLHVLDDLDVIGAVDHRFIA